MPALPAHDNIVNDNAPVVRRGRADMEKVYAERGQEFTEKLKYRRFPPAGFGAAD
jgi:hypothetical protein